MRREARLLPLLYGAGLATGLARFPEPALLAFALLAALATAWRRGAWVLWWLVPAAGALAGALARQADARSCAAVLPGGPLALTVRLTEPADSAGGLLQARPVGPGCAGTLGLRWPRGVPVAAGALVGVEGTLVRRERGLAPSQATLAVRRWTLIGAEPGPGERLRTALFRASRALYGPRAGLVDALVVGRRGTLDPSLSEVFAASGLVHLLSISGFHVGVIVAWVVALARLGALRARGALVLGAAVAAAYVVFLGWPAPAARAALLAALAALVRVRQRHTDAESLLAATCLVVLLLDPWAAVDLGAWLSGSAMWGLLHFSAWSDRRLGTGWFWRTLSGSLGATLATAPITAAALGSVAPVGLLLNFVAIPLAAVAVPGAVLSLALAWVPPLAALLATGTGTALALLEAVAEVGARVPGGQVVQATGPVAALPWLAVLAVALWAIHGRSRPALAAARVGWAAAAGLWGLLLLEARPGPRPGARDLTLLFLDVGQGDAALLRTPGGVWLAIDAGPALGDADAGRRVVVPTLRREGARRLAALFVSHAHADHVGGAAAILQRLPVDLVVEPGRRFEDPGYEAFLGEIVAQDVPWKSGRPGDRWVVDGVSVTVLHPDTLWTGWGEDLNEDSLVLLVEYGGFRALFTGDAGLPAEAVLARKAGDVTLLKVGHHGSRGATGAGFLAAVRAEVAVISAGRGNRYGHPSPEALERLRAAGTDTWRTDEDGTVRVTTDGRRLVLDGRQRRRTLDLTVTP